MATKSKHSTFVHELTLAAEELQERYRKQQVILLYQTRPCHLLWPTQTGQSSPNNADHL